MKNIIGIIGGAGVAATNLLNDLIEFDKECKICKNKIIGGAMYFQKLPEIGIKENIIIQNENDSIDNSQREKKEN